MRNDLAAAALTALIASLLAWPSSAGATAIGPSPKHVSGAFTATSSCGSLSGVGVTWTVTANVVTTVVLTSIPSSCIGGSLSLTLVDATNTSLASAGPVTLTATTQTLTSLTGAATATSVSGGYLSVVGP